MKKHKKHQNIESESESEYVRSRILISGVSGTELVVRGAIIGTQRCLALFGLDF